MIIMNKKLIQNKKGMTSIPMLLLQIASIIVITIAVSMLITQIQITKEEGSIIPIKTMGMAKTGLNVRDIIGHSIDGNISDIEGLTISVNLLAGSDPINLKKSKIYIIIGNRSASLNIINGSSERNITTGYYTE